MARYELTINSKYVPSWTVWEGIREVVQNVLDGQDDGYGMVIKENEESVSFTNKGLQLNNSVLLTGTSTKTYRSDQRGQWGEGLKLGLLALERNNIGVEILNGAEKWTPSLEDSRVFRDGSGPVKVLTINTRKLPKSVHDFTVKINIPKRDWLKYKERILPLKERQPTTLIAEGGSSILIDEDLKGHLFAGGIWVAKIDKLSFGYDLREVELDRDRRIPKQFDMSWKIGQLWYLVMANIGKVMFPDDPGASGKDSEEYKEAYDTAKRVYELLSEDRLDVMHMLSQAFTEKEKDLVGRIITRVFRDKYGDVYPVTSDSQWEELQKLKKSGKFVSDSLANALRGHLGDWRYQVKKLESDVAVFHDLGDLSLDKRVVLFKGIMLVSLVVEDSFDSLLGRVSPVDFTQEKTEGSSHVNDNGVRRVLVSTRVLGSLKDTLRVLVREFSYISKKSTTDDVVHYTKRPSSSVWADIVETLMFSNEVWSEALVEAERLAQRSYSGPGLKILD